MIKAMTVASAGRTIFGCGDGLRLHVPFTITIQFDGEPQHDESSKPIATLESGSEDAKNGGYDGRDDDTGNNMSA